jgi:hypothetical protein
MVAGGVGDDGVASPPTGLPASSDSTDNSRRVIGIDQVGEVDHYGFRPVGASRDQTLASKVGRRLQRCRHSASQAWRLVST